jgi:OmpA-OmpF porin, OOP family
MKKILVFIFFISVVNTYCQKLEATEKEALLTVHVNNLKGKALEGETVAFVAKSTGKSFSGVTKADGTFGILLPEGDEYQVQYKAFTENRDYKNVSIPSMEGLIEFDYTLTLGELDKTFTLKDVLYDTGKSTLRPESYKELNELVEFMKLKKSLVIEVAGHSDNTGAKDSNFKLSEDRAKTVRDYLLKKGIDPSRVTAKGYGDSQPLQNNSFSSGQQKNRRTEIKVISQ